jgi:nucleoside phosphorylase/CheY-like chemotaxis protein
MIKILILEDNEVKRKKIKELILENEHIKSTDIIITVCSNDSRRELYTKEFDLFIIDLLVPANIDDEATATESINLLYDINNDDLIKKPLHIFGLSAFEDKIQEYEKHFTNKDWHLIQYSESSHNWKDILNSKLKHILDSKKCNHSEQYRYDIGIICALNDPEFKHIKKLSDEWVPLTLNNNSLEFYTTVFKRDGKELSVIAISINQMGMVSTSILATQMIELFRPKYLTMTGIAAGIEGESELGEVLVIEHSWDYNSGKIKTNEDGSKKFEVDMRQEPLDRDLYNKMTRLQRDTPFLHKLYLDYQGNKPKTYLEISICQVASGAAVVANNEIIKDVTSQARKLKGIEMEAYGLFCAASNATNLKPKALVIKSVCDFADENKNDNIQDYAAYSSANVLYEFIMRYL